jgi:hypothetical protein
LREDAGVPVINRSSVVISVVVNANVGGPSGQTRLIIVIQKIRQLRMQYTEIRLTSQPLGCAQLGFLGLAAGLQNLVEGLDLPPHGITARLPKHQEANLIVIFFQPLHLLAGVRLNSLNHSLEGHTLTPDMFAKVVAIR